jgi:Beta-propeller repeat
MNRAHFIGIFLLVIACLNSWAQTVQLTTYQNGNLFFAATDLTTNGVAGLTNTAPNLVVSSVSQSSSYQGIVSMVSTQAWVQRGGGPNYGAPYKVVVDTMQNVIVAGGSTAFSSGEDFLTIKYAGDRTPLWTNRYDGSAHLDDDSGCLVVDASGNVYVTGSSEVTNMTWDVVTLKYSATGNLLWASRYNRYGTNYCGSSGLAVDTAGNVFVTANIYYAATAFITIKYDPQGNAVWTNYYKGSPDGSDYVGTVAVDNSGNSFVTGDSDGMEGSMDYATLKYAPDGIAVWTNRYINGWTAIPSAMILDPSANVVVTGDSFSSSHLYSTVKYSNDGIPLWTNLAPAPTYQGGKLPVVASDLAGDVFLTGGSPGADSTNANFTTVKLSVSGTPLWTNRFFEINFDNPAPAGTAVDSAGNFYFAGHSRGAGGTNVSFVTIKYDPAGGAIWTNRYGSLTAGSTAEAEGLAVDRAGHVYVAGFFGYYFGYGSGPSDFVTVKYSDYIRYTPPANFIGTDSFTFTAVDAFGNSATGVVNVAVLPANLQFKTDLANLWNHAQGMHLRVDGAHGTNAVIIYASSDLVQWEPIFTNQPAQGSVEFTDQATPTMPRRFYRATQPQ